MLFVDEAGQISLANVIAMARATDSLVLLGDPQQLDQPLQGSHPPGADRSALAHVLGDQATMPPDRGLFLEHTWRLHPALCAFTSEVFYDGRLEAAARAGSPATRLRRGPARRGRTARHRGGRRPAPTANRPIEAERVAALARSLVGGGASWIDRRGIQRPIGWDDVLIVAPYNAQVGAIKRLLPAGGAGRDRRQVPGPGGADQHLLADDLAPRSSPRGAWTSSTAGNRLNVATSRARCVAVVVGSPDLWRVRARTPEQMRLANAFCRFIELAAAPPVAVAPAVAIEVLTLGLD